MPVVAGSSFDPVAVQVVGLLKERGVVEALLLDRDIISEGFGGIFDPKEVVVVPSIHKSDSGIRCLTVHFTGVFGEGFGKAPAIVAKALLKALKSVSDGLEGYEVTMEATHHGPFGKDEPQMAFIEIGSDETAWKDKAAVYILADAIELALTELLPDLNVGEAAIGLGGGHYARTFTKVNLSVDEVAMGHIASKHVIDSIDLKILEEMSENTFPKATSIILDWKGLKGPERARFIEFGKVLGLKLLRYRKGELSEL